MAPKRDDPSSSPNDPSKSNGVAGQLAAIRDRLETVEAHLATIAQPINKRSAPDRSWIERIADSFETNPFSRFVIGLGAFLAVLSFVGVAATAWGIWLQYQSIEEERVARAWQSLSFPATGNSGKGEAIEYLNRRGERLVGINIGGTNKATGPFVDGLTLTDADLWRTIANYGQIENVDFHDVNLVWAKANNALITGSMVNTRFVWSELVSATIGLHSGSTASFFNSLMDGVNLHPDHVERGGPLEYDESNRPSIEQRIRHHPRLSFESSSLRCANLAYWPVNSFRFEDVDISGAYFDFYEFVDSDAHSAAWKNLRGAWYFSDNPPVGIPPAVMKENLLVRDRQQVLGLCREHEPRARREDPLGNLDGPDGIEIACVSLAKNAEKCTPYSPDARLNSLWYNPEEYGLENAPNQ